MKCSECKGRGHFLFPMSTPTCEACGGTGAVEDRGACVEMGVLFDFGQIPAGLEAWLPEEYRLPTRKRQSYGSRPSRLAGVKPADFELPAPTFNLQAALLQSATIGRAAKQLDEDEQRLREAVADWAVGAVGEVRTGPPVFDVDRHVLDVPTSGPPLAVPGELISTHFRTAVAQCTGRLLSVDVREGEEWKRWRTFERAEGW